MVTPEPGRVTRLLRDWKDGDDEAFEQLLQEVYGELRRLAATYLSRERRGHTLQPTALVHEAYLRLVATDPATMSRRTHFFAAAAQAMRRILVESARRRSADKRQEALDVVFELSERQREIELLDLDRALCELARISERQARLAELRYFGGLTIHEASNLMGASTATLERDWRIARVWLRHRLADLRVEPCGVTEAP